MKKAGMRVRRAKIRLVRLDLADEIVGLKFGDEFNAIVAQTSGGVIFYQVDAPGHPEYYLRHEQVEAVKK